MKCYKALRTSPKILFVASLFAAMTTLSPPLVMAAAPLSSPKTNHGRQVEITGDRILLGDISSTVPRELFFVDIAPAPALGKSIRVSRNAIRAALQRAGADQSFSDGLPAHTMVYRKSQRVPADQLQQKIRQILTDKLPKGLRITDLRGVKDLLLPVGPYKIDLKLNKINRVTQARAKILVRGKQAALLPISISLDGTASTPVLRRNLPNKSIIKKDDIAWKPTPIEKLPNHVALRAKDLQGRQLSQPVRAGKPIQRTAVVVPLMVTRGHEVNLVAQGLGIRITQPARAQEDGRFGDWIRVVPINGGRVLRAKVVAAGQAQIDLGGQKP